MALSKTAILASLMFFALGRLAAPAGGQSERGGDVELGTPPVKPFYWLDKSRSIFTPLASAISVSTQNRPAVVNLFDTVYIPALAVPMGWTGSIAGCVAGTTSQAYIDATMDMINYFRAMSGLPGDVANVVSLNDDSQEAALMMIAEGSLSHSPLPGWACFTTTGADAAGNSNLALGNAGPNAIVGYMRDQGASNQPVGHRRWILYPPQVQMATGSTDGVNGLFFGSNVLYVFAGFGSRPGAPSVVAWPGEGFVPYQVVYPRWSLSLNSEPFADYSTATVTMTKDAANVYVFAGFGSRPGAPSVVAWPGEGFVPYQVVYPRWSLSLNSEPFADYSTATVTMTKDAANVPLTVVSRTDSFGDNTLVWEPSGLSFGAGQADQTVSVTVSNIMVGGNPQSVSYDVIVIDPALGSGDADLSITKADTEDPALAGTGLIYTVTVSNAGPAAAEDVTVDDTLPGSVIFSATNGCTNDPNGVPTCSLGTIAAGASGSFQVTVAVGTGASGTIANSVSVSSSNNDPVGANDGDSEDTLINAPTSCSTGTINLTAGDSTSDATFLTESSITAGSGFQAQSGGTVHFRAGTTIALTNGFSTAVGANFRVVTDPLVTCP